MIPPPRPADDDARVKALRDAELLDTPPERDWDDLTRIACAVAGAPIGLVGLIDDQRQWFKARVGIEASEVPRELTICGYTILQEGVFEVQDVQADARFHDNPSVVDLDVRFYAGAPIIDDKGYALGTVCVVDHVPRKLDEQQREALEALARQASARLKVRDRARDLVRMHEEQQRSLAMMEATLEATADGILCLDLSGNVLFCNDRFLSMFGFPRPLGERGIPNPMLGPGLSRLKDPEAFRRLIADQNEQPEADRFDVLELADGRTFERYSRPAWASGRRVGWVSCYRDVTERRQVENLKNEFVSTVSHELRTPLTAIRGAMGLLEGGVVGELPAPAKELVTISRSNSERLIRLVNDILDLEKVEQGKADLQPRDLEGKKVVEVSLSNVQPLAEAAGVRLVSRVAAPAIHADEDRLVQVLTNLLSNAVKFSPAGEQIELDVTPARRGGVRIEVRDRGPGIPPEQRHKLFRRFQQLDQSDTRAKGGTGLGLAICKAIVEQHRGSIGAEERDGGGTTFWLELPPSHASAPVVDSRAVLVAVADAVLLGRLEAAITSAGAKPLPVKTLVEAERALAEGAARAAIVEVPFDGTDPIEWLTRLRTGSLAPIPIALIHGEAGRFSAPLIVDAADTSRDARLLRALCSSAVAAAHGEHTARVLIADDDPTFRQVMRQQLEQIDVEVIEAADGTDALAQVRRTRPHVIVLDVGMPGLDGYDVVAALRQEAGRAAALLVYSGRSLNDRDRERLRLGVTRFLTKGEASETQFLEAVRQLVSATVQ